MKLLYPFLLLITHSAFGQWKDFKSYNYNIKFHQGIILKHSKEVAHLANQRPFAAEIDVNQRTDGKKLWHQIHHYPYVGLSLNYIWMDPEKPLGNMGAAVFYMGKTVFSTSRSKMVARLGLGPGYAGRKFHLYHNFKNIMLSSHFNYCMVGRVEYIADIGSKFTLHAGLGILHLSNGAHKLPDQGINIPTIHIGMGFQKIKKEIFIIDSLPRFVRKLNFDIAYTIGLKEEYPTGGPLFMASTITSYLNWRVNRKSGLTFGMDFFYDPSVKRYYKDESLPFSRKIKAGISFGHELFLGKLSFLTQLGFYFYDKNKIYLPVYERIGLKYDILKPLFLHMNMRLHIGSIDNVEMGIGIKI